MNDDGPSLYDGAELTQVGARFWLTIDGWTIGEAAYLLNAIDPQTLNRWAALNGGRLAVRFPEQFKAVQALLRRAAEAGALRFPALPTDVIEWAMTKNLRLPAPLVPDGAVVHGGRWFNHGARAEDGDSREAEPSAGPVSAHRIKRAALIERHARQWPSIERDLKDASTNGLSTDAKAVGVGWWQEDKALTWATERGKLKAGMPVASVFTSTTHKIKG